VNWHQRGFSGLAIYLLRTREADLSFINGQYLIDTCKFAFVINPGHDDLCEPTHSCLGQKGTLRCTETELCVCVSVVLPLRYVPLHCCEWQQRVSQVDVIIKSRRRRPVGRTSIASCVLRSIEVSNARSDERMSACQMRNSRNKGARRHMHSCGHFLVYALVQHPAAEGGLLLAGHLQILETLSSSGSSHLSWASCHRISTSGTAQHSSRPRRIVALRSAQVFAMMATIRCLPV